MFGTIASYAFAQDPRTPLASDTGRMTRGYADFSRYTTPGMCETAVRSITARLRRSGDKDSLSITAKYTDTIPTIALETGRQCAKHLSLATTTPLELYNLQKLAIALGNKSLADSVVASRLTIAKTVHDSARVFQQSAIAYAEAQPIQLEAAQAAEVQLERLGPKARAELFGAQVELLRVAVDRFDVPRMRQISTSALATAALLSPDERDELVYSIKEAWRAYVAAVQWESPDSATFAVAQMEQDIAPLRNGNTFDWFDGFRRAFESKVRPQLGKPVVSFTTDAQYVYPSSVSQELRRGLLSKDTVHLVLLVSEVNSMRGVVRRLSEKYAAQGLQITMVSGLKGYTLWNESGVLTPQEEAVSQKEYLDSLHLPVSLVVEDASYTSLPDGRRRYEFTQWQQRTPVGAFIVDRNGVLRMGFTFVFEKPIDAYLQRTFSSQSPPQGDTARVK